MARGGDQAEAVALEVVVWAAGKREFVLAAVAGASVDVADGEGAATRGGGQVDLAAETA